MSVPDSEQECELLHDDVDDERPKSPKSVRDGPEVVWLCSSSNGSDDGSNCLEQPEPPLESPPEILHPWKDIVLDGLGGAQVKNGCVAGSRQGTWTRKENVKKKIVAEISKCQDSLLALSNTDETLRTIFECKEDSTTVATATTEMLDCNPHPKQVRFQVRSDGKVRAETTVKSLCTVRLSNDEIRSMWWSKRERIEMKSRAHAVASQFLATSPEYRSATEQLLLKCCDESGNKMGWEIYQTERVDRIDPFSYDEAIRIVANHGARGLEQAMVAALNLQSCRFYHKCGRTSIVSVLEAQAMWKTLSCSSAEQQGSMIAMQHRQYSGFAARFARMLAEGDANVAGGIYSDADNDFCLL